MMRFCCRTHGEPLVFDCPRFWWACPEYRICGTYVTEEFIDRRTTE